jgi:hypothetical protein
VDVRHGIAVLAAAIGCSEEEYVRQIRDGRDWCSRRENEDGTVGHWVPAEEMSSSTTRMCRPCQADARRKTRTQQRARSA